jgi:predicted RNA-binding protein with PUA-like domain
MNHWLMKSEPESFSIEDLMRRPQQTEPWDGVRNYQARNWLRDAMRVGDHAFFYHSNCAEPGIVGIVLIVRAGYPDDTALDPDNHHYDPKHTADKPRWYCVDVRFVRRLKRVITLAEMKESLELKGFALVQRGSRLSVMPVSAAHWKTILALE